MKKNLKSFTQVSSGAASLLKSAENKQTRELLFFIKTLSFSNLESINTSKIKVWKTLSNLKQKTKSIAHFFDFYLESLSFANDKFKLHFLFENMSTTLEKKKTIDRPMEFQILIEYFEKLTNSLAFFQILGIIPTYLTPANIFLKNIEQDDQLFILDLIESIFFLPNIFLRKMEQMKNILLLK